MTELRRSCPVCQKDILYKGKWDFTQAEKKKSKCSSCAKKGNARRLGKPHSDVTKQKMSASHTGMVHTEQHRLNVSLSRRGNKHWLYGKSQPESVKEKLRTAHKKRLSEFREKGIPFRVKGKIKTSYNPDACKLFDIINTELHWNGKHALNGGEVQIAGYWVDFYEETVKLIVEYDEKHHSQPSRKDRDLERQQTIQSYLPDYTIIRVRYDESQETIIQRLREYANSKK